MQNEITFHLNPKEFPLDGLSIGDVFEFEIEGTVEKIGLENHYAFEEGAEKRGKCLVLNIIPKKIEHSLLENKKMQEMIRDNGR